MQGLKTRNDSEAYWHTAEGRALEAYYNKVNRIAEKKVVFSSSTRLTAAMTELCG